MLLNNLVPQDFQKFKHLINFITHKKFFIMKKITTLVCALTFFYGFSQNAPIDFETGGNGADWTWTVFENDTNPDLEIIANPDATGANTSASVAKFTALETGNPWAGVESLQGADLGEFTLDENTSTIKIMVWKTVISDVGIKLVSSTDWSQGEIKIPNTVVNQWEEITFDFSNFINPPSGNGVLNQIVIFPDFDLSGRNQDNIIYFDNISFSAGGGGGGGDEPMTAAPTPTAAPENVISIYSDAYTDVPVDTFLTSWSSALFAEVQIQSNPTLKYTNVDFLGIETVATQVNASAMEYFHLDVWTPNMDLLRIKLVDFGADGAFGGGDDTEHEIEFSGLPQNQWNSLHIPLSDFTGLSSTSNIAQYILSGTPVGSGTLYVDNIYFTTEPLSSNSNELEANLSVYPNPATSHWNIVNKTTQEFTVNLFDVTGKLISSFTNDGTSSNLLIDASGLNSGFYFAKVATQNASKTIKLIKK